MWGAQRWPVISSAVGALPLLGMLHTFLAWLFAAFLGMHVYLTTTGATPLEGIRSMLIGWEGDLTEDPADSPEPEESLTS